MKTYPLRALMLCLVLALSPVFSSRASTVGYSSTNAFPSLTFTNPVCLATPPGETNRLFVVEQKGRIVVITNLAAPTRTLFMDITARVTNVGTEEGLLGLAFHPDYANNGFFYVFYTGNATTAAGSGRHDILSRFQMTAGNSNQGDTNSEVRFIVQRDEADNHNGGDLHFGADGYLYVSLGDEGGSFCSFGNCQRIDLDFFSAIMRLDVDKQPGNLSPNGHASALPSLTNYAIPFDNPWIGATQFNVTPVNSNQVRTEFWAVGMRNPWRWSFDPLTGELYLGHVGQNTIEWVDIVTNGANCGWEYFEGNLQVSTPPSGFTYLHPLVEYGHTNSRNCVIGGIVYRGDRMPALNGSYLYADNGSGEIWALRHSGATVTQNPVIIRDTNAFISCFGVDPSNNDPLYAALRSGTNSMIKRIVMTNSIPVFTGITLTGANLVMSGSNGAPNTSYYVLQSPVVASPATWTKLSTNAFDGSGNFIFTNPFNPDVPQEFYILQLP